MSERERELVGADCREFLRWQCSRLMHGQCSTRRCLMRGGYSGRGPVDYALATCEPYEIDCALSLARATRSAE